MASFFGGGSQETSQVGNSTAAVATSDLLYCHCTWCHKECLVTNSNEGRCWSCGRPVEDGRLPEALLLAREAVRTVLAGFHVLDCLPERSRILAVDAELPVHQVLAVALREQHLQSPSQRTRSGSSGSYHGEMRRQMSPSSDQSAKREAHETSTQRPPLCCGMVAPSLPSNILAEVCEFEAFSASAENAEGQDQTEPPEEATISASFRRWTSPDDGWGKDPSIPKQDLERMPMGMPVTVSELANFLMHACDGPPPPPVQEPPAESSFWARARGRSDPAPTNATSQDADIFDWTLAQWRAHRMKMAAEQEQPGQKEAAAEASLDGRWSGGTISGTILIWNDGTSANIKIVQPKKFTVRAGDQTLDAALEDDGKLHWADGEIWEKDAIGNKLQYEPFFMPEQRYIRLLQGSFCSLRKESEFEIDPEPGALEEIWSQEVPCDDYSSKLTALLGRAPKDDDLVKTRENAMMTFQELVALEGDDLRKVFPITMKLKGCSLVASHVLVHRVASATPRPILCTDDTEASLLKAVTLLLAYPDLDAVPIVSPARCTVVAHLTLGYILAFVMGRLRGNELGSLRELLIAGGGGAVPAGSRLIQRVFTPEASGETARWAESKLAEASKPLVWVLRRSQPMRDLLKFFASTTHTCIPIVEDGSDSSIGGGFLGLLSRRDLLHFLDLAMRSARRRATQDGILDENDDEAEIPPFDATAPVEVILNTLRSHQHQQAQDDTAPHTNSAWVGAGLVFEQELTFHSVVLKLLLAENRKLLFVEAAGESAPRISRLLSVGDAWRLLIGDLDKIVQGHMCRAQIPDDELPENEARA